MTATYTFDIFSTLDGFADEHQHVSDAAVLQFGQHVRPALGALAAVAGGR